MSVPSEFLVRLNGETRGPFAPARLRELAEAGVITPQTEAARSAAGPWTALRDLPEGADLFPQRRQFQFKAREFEPVNEAGVAPVELRTLIAAANRGRSPPAKTPTPVPPPGDALQIVRENTRIQLLHEKPVDLTPPPNRRRRDYFLAMTVVNGCFVLSLLFGGGGIFALSGIVLASAGITWVMFGVMDRY